MAVGAKSITGTLHHVTGYTGFSSNPAEQSGNFLALSFATDPADGVTTTVELVGGSKGPVTLDEDMNCVFRVTKTSQSIKVVATKGEETITKNYSLAGLVLETEEP